MRAFVVLPALVLALVAAAPASADLPKPKSTTIVPGKSIAGVKVGMTVGQALAVWGPSPDCTADTRLAICWYRGTLQQGDASFTVANGKVRTVGISTGRRGTDLIYSGPLQRWRTRKGIKLGSTVRQIVKAYPKTKGAPYGVSLGSGSHTTAFLNSLTRIYSISVGTID